MPGEHAEGKEGCEQNAIGKGPLENHLRDFIEEVLKYEIKRGLILNKEIHLLNEENDHIDEDEAAQTESENLQIFTNGIPMEDPMALKHLRRVPSIFFE
jgi:hypothetical protein